MTREDPVPEYTEGGSLEDDLRRIAGASNNTTATTQDSITFTPPPLSNNIPEPEINSGDPDTDELIRRLIREDAEEEAGAQRRTSASGPIPHANIVQTFFDAIENENSELISAFIDGGFVKVDTKNNCGVTPLVAAVRANHVRIVQQLVDYGADVNEMTLESDPSRPYYRRYRHGHLIPNPYEYLMRTPLMVAAENGHLPLVKLFVEVFHAKDDIVPPDGMIALRLAAKNGHREIVDYLPSRRTGGMQRWQYKNRNSVRRARIILIDIYWFLRIVVYEVPRFFVWSIPKHVIVLPVKRSAVYLWKHKKDIADGIKDGIVATGRGIAKYAKKAAVGTIKGIKGFPAGTVRVVKATARGIVTGVKATWKFLTVDFPKLLVRFIKATLKFIKDAAIGLKNAIVSTAKALKKFTIWLVKSIWKLITVTIPKLISVTFKWIWNAIKYVSKGIAGFFVRLASAVHTLITKMVNWVSGITWKDVLNGFLETLKFVFVGIPKMIVDGIIHTGKFIKKVLKTLFGWAGEVIYYIGIGIILVVVYLPRKIFELFLELFKSIGRGLHEIAVWINPKTVG
ncbi:hypothetical protein TWF106_009088 [Orbilia oligospora]|uniref:Uncharacterized protein n=1 Tax=Orbilia oligospora TaxID=2813651 RepID=A0A6G1MA64_ORBOL|nr:hypothetical protein TWF788_009085 [Orbilia oligospora]KAF3214962.1 hypothetical protein TWF191_009652 [Orbilia oligospora]KAF3216447.1 hypothetical protein TWF679_003062 [Orbilia oligospora]KAF3227571.1 hypothetical protein TWF106_009088 [Orbilia oligospora]KAF3251066.1 hypothetical protein TWF192_005044 [Orbilia oligospora]